MNLKTIALLAAVLLPTTAFGAPKQPTVFDSPREAAVRGVIPVAGWRHHAQGAWKTERDYPRPNSRIRWPDPRRMCMQFGCNHPL